MFLSAWTSRLPSWACSCITATFVFSYNTSHIATSEQPISVNGHIRYSCDMSCQVLQSMAFKIPPMPSGKSLHQQLEQRDACSFKCLAYPRLYIERCPLVANLGTASLAST
ncbi:hypothetical protein B0T17DRAFT_387803 [Bombardia bombarda]|uniref:Secreted protein n=1 Tax=Bombardia bombarda TaxID=252184 RepID=A0AA39WCJ4_9PEZI|nr:hypothetical protein B0T17DRAFT_387803 [Bombardia bombarda]